MKPQIIAHRGWSGRYPENTLISFEKALELSVDGIEFDLRMTADRKIVISHNFNVDLRSNGTGFIADKTLAELKKLDFGIKKGEEFAGTRIPEFGELLDLVEAKRPDIWLAVEIKDDDWDLAKRVFKELEHRGFDSHCSIISFKPNVLRAAKEYAPHIPRHGFSVLNLTAAAGEDDYLNLINRVGINVKQLTMKMTAFYHERGITVDTWAPGNTAEYVLARACGVDYLTTNDPDVILPLQEKYPEL
ncbi:MAG: hypothetical protein J6Y54_07720 [Lentisphaeria bacterium]|jgi:glycerophosphoryl diester phosphodiesterase|nr:hypothetical protein [Lentisphaeria bacterium]